MKRIIRECVFETNSSSCHSIVYKNKENIKKEEKEIGKKVDSRLEKICLIMSLLNHAKFEIEYPYKYFENIFKSYFGEDIEKTKKDMVEKLFIWLNKYLDIQEFDDYYFYKEDEDKFWYFKEDLWNYGTYNYGKWQKVFEYEGEDKIIEMKLMYDAQCFDAKECKDALSRIYYVDLLIAINHIIGQLNKEYEGRDTSIFKDYVKFFNEVFEGSSGIDFYFINKFEPECDFAERLKEKLFDAYCELEGKTREELENEIKNTNFVEEKYYCEKIFGCGSLSDCGCGFESFNDIYKKLKIEYENTDNELFEKAKEILSDENYFLLGDKRNNPNYLKFDI